MKVLCAVAGAPLSRRELLRWSGAAAAALLLDGCKMGLSPRRAEDASSGRGQRGADATSATRSGAADLDAARPILSVVRPAGGFLGDDVTRPHAALWDVQRFLGERGGAPAASERARLVVVGGGMSGLATAYLHRAASPVVLEQAPQFGGNSRGERWHDIAYSIGAAYLARPEATSRLYTQFYGPLGIAELWRESGEDPVVFGGVPRLGFWEGTTDPPRAARFVAVKRYFLEVLHGAYPDLPPGEGSALAPTALAALDRQTFREHLEARVGPLHPHVETLLQHYCWSSFGGSLDEISAASGLNFVAAEFAGICALPGGNATIADRLMAALRQDLPPDHLRPGSVVVQVKLARDGVLVTALDPGGRLYTIEAAAAVMACPKFVARQVLLDMPAPQRAAVERIRYRAYVVANLLVAAPSPAPALDLYLLGDGETPRDAEAAATRQRVTDVVFGHWARHGHPTHSVLTLYRGYPYDGARAALLSPGAHARWQAELEEQVPEILGVLGIARERVVEARIARWGHALPLAAAGLLADGTWAAARAAIDERIFFVEQDNWPAPALETALAEALESAPRVRAALR